MGSAQVNGTLKIGGKIKMSDFKKIYKVLEDYLYEFYYDVHEDGRMAKVMDDWLDDGTIVIGGLVDGELDEDVIDLLKKLKIPFEVFNRSDGYEINNGIFYWNPEGVVDGYQCRSADHSGNETMDADAVRHCIAQIEDLLVCKRISKKALKKVLATFKEDTFPAIPTIPMFELIEDDVRIRKELLAMPFNECQAILMEEFSDLDWDSVNNEDAIYDYINSKMRESVVVAHILHAMQTRRSSRALYKMNLGSSMNTPEPIDANADLLDALGWVE